MIDITGHIYAFYFRLSIYRSQIIYIYIFLIKITFWCPIATHNLSTSLSDTYNNPLYSWLRWKESEMRSIKFMNYSTNINSVNRFVLYKPCLFVLIGEGKCKLRGKLNCWHYDAKKGRKYIWVQNKNIFIILPKEMPNMHT